MKSDLKATQQLAVISAASCLILSILIADHYGAAI